MGSFKNTGTRQAGKNQWKGTQGRLNPQGRPKRGPKTCHGCRDCGSFFPSRVCPDPSGSLERKPFKK